MRTVIKSTEATGGLRVRPLGTAAPEAAPPRIDAEKAQLLADIDRLSEDVEAGESRIHRLELELAQAFEAGRAAGFAAGVKEGDTLRADSLALLGTGIEAALTRFGQDLTALESLSVLLVREALAKLIGEESDRQSLVTALLLHQLKAVEANSVVRLEVSRADFPDASALIALSDRSEVPLIQVVAESGLASGDCRIRLALGTLEVGLDQQWGELSNLLADLARRDLT